MSQVTVRSARAGDRAAILALADRLSAFQPATREPVEISSRERRALDEALSQPVQGSAMLVAEHLVLGIVGVILLEIRRDYFTDAAHGYISILAVAREVEGQGVGGALMQAAEDWGRTSGFGRLTLNVFMDNRHAKEFYAHQGWRPEMETWFKELR